jgi:hypothetical protein
VEVDAPSLEELNEGDFSIGVSYTPKGQTDPVHFLFESSQGAELFMLARVGDPLSRRTFETFYGVAANKVSTSFGAAWWQSLKANSANIVLATLGSLAVLPEARVEAPPRTGTPRINLADPRPSTPAPTTAAVGTQAKGSYRPRFLTASETPPQAEVHHTLFQKYEADFRSIGVNIHEERFLRGVDAPLHRQITKRVAKLERDLGRRLSTDEVLDLAARFDAEYGTQLIHRKPPTSTGRP